MVAMNDREPDRASANARPVVVATERLVLRWLDAGDADFILELTNDPDWLRFIGDRGIRSIEDARRYIEDGPVAMYARLGFGLYAVEVAEGVTIGICGLVKRDWLDDVDLGFAFLPRFRGAGYAHEAAAATLTHARTTLALKRLLAIVSADNLPSRRLLERLGFTFERMQPPDGKDGEVCVYARSTG
jgi:[ribosomal protein S5]-alanine N-acetyltransferase